MNRQSTRPKKSINPAARRALFQTSSRVAALGRIGAVHSADEVDGRSRPIAAPDYKQNYFSTHYCA